MVTRETAPAARARVDFQSLFRLTELADYIIPFAIGVIAEVGVADQLAAGSRTVEEIAVATGTHAPSLNRTLRALAAKGIFTEVAPGTFGLTPMAELLRSDHPLSLRDGLRLQRADVQAWAHVEHSIRTGEPAFHFVHGQGFWEYLAAHPDEGARFDRSQAAMTRIELLGVQRAHAWGELRTVVDVGGGNGAFLAGLLAQHPAMHGVLYDLPHVVEGAAAVLRDAGVDERCEVVGGSYFDAVPSGADAYILKRVLWGHDDDEAGTILQNVAAAMRPDSRLLIVEPLRQNGDAYEIGKLLDLKLLVMGGHGSRSREEVERLVARTRLRLTGVAPALITSIGVVVLEAAP